MLWAKNKKGFTIVELLIVVVVIAILAAITIVSYNGIQNRAKASAAQSAASQAGKKLNSYAILNAETFPTASALSAAVGMAPSFDNSTPYQYSLGLTDNTYCLTVTTNNLSYYVTKDKVSPTQGACPGHGVNGAAPTTVTNLIANPSLDVNSSGWALHSALSGGRVQDGSRWVYTGTRTGGGATAIYISQASPVTVTANTVYSGSVYVKSSVDQTIQFQLRIGGTTTAIVSESVAMTANVPQRLTLSTNVGANTNVFLTVLSSSGSVGDVITADEAMLTQGSTVYSYLDGNSPSWTWTGTAGLSTSTGPAF